jgi:hypothetical protein
LKENIGHNVHILELITIVKKMNPRMFIAALVIIASNWKQSKCSSIGE